MTRFAPGQSGNPGGRPKGERAVRELAQDHCSTAIERLVEIMLDKGEDSRACVAAAKVILDRGLGRVPLPITGGDGEGPIVVEVRRFADA